MRSVGGPLAERKKDPRYDPMLHEFTIDYGIHLVPSTSLEDRLAGRAPSGALTRAEVKEYIRRHHSHAPKPPAGWKWGYAIYNGPAWDPVYKGKPRTAGGRGSDERPVGLVEWPRTLIGVVMVGKPGARLTAMREQALARLRAGESPEQVAKATKLSLVTVKRWAAAPPPLVVELTRMALDHGLPSFLRYQAASLAYRQAAEDAARLGYDVIETFTREEEVGMSLRYARWKPVATRRGGGQWGRKGRARAERGAELSGPKVRWEKRLRRPT